MTTSAFYEEGSNLLTPVAFAFVLEGELKRAVRAQTYITLVLVEAAREWEGVLVTADEATVHEMGAIIGGEVRSTDVLGHSDTGALALALVDSDLEGSSRVIERIVSRMEHYEFPAPLRIAVGAACYPTHASDAEALTREAMARPVVSWRRALRPHDAHNN
jgi:hypothetical protein